MHALLARLIQTQIQPPRVLHAYRVLMLQQQQLPAPSVQLARLIPIAAQTLCACRARLVNTQARSPQHAVRASLARLIQI
jgi:hypothetical protein